MAVSGFVIEVALAVLPVEFSGSVTESALDVIPSKFSGWVQEEQLIVAVPVYSGTTEGKTAAVAPPQSFGGTTEDSALVLPAQGYSATTGGSTPAVVGDQFGGTTEGRSVVVPQGFSGPSSGHVSPTTPARSFSGMTIGTTGGIPAPINLTAVAIDAGCIRLDWDDVSDEESGYRIDRSLTTANDWEEIGTTGENVVTFLDRFAIPLVVYDYRVVGTDPGRVSLPSNIATAVTALPPELNVTPPPVTEDPLRNRLQTKPFDLLSPGVYGLEKDLDDNVTGFKA